MVESYNEKTHAYLPCYILCHKENLNMYSIKILWFILIISNPMFDNQKMIANLTWDFENKTGLPSDLIFDSQKKCEDEVINRYIKQTNAIKFSPLERYETKYEEGTLFLNKISVEHKEVFEQIFCMKISTHEENLQRIMK